MSKKSESNPDPERDDDARKAPKQIEKVKADNEKVPEKLIKAENEKFIKQEIKELKVEKREFKEQKLEVKELKGDKNELKEAKQEHKEFKNEHKELKVEKDEIKEFDKPAGEKPGPAEGRGEIPDPTTLPVDREALLQHADALEHAAQQLRHFIDKSERPDLSRGALQDEPDEKDDS